MSRTTFTWRAAAATAAAGLVLAACGGTTSDDEESSEASGGGGDCTASLGFFGALTGDYAALGQNIKNGVQLAIDQYEGDCDVTLEEYDSKGSEVEAPDLAKSAIDDDEVIGIVGPAFSGESAAAGPIFADAGLPTITPSATDPSLSENGWETFFRMLGNDNTQGPAAAAYISDTVGSTEVFVIDDATQYGAGLATIVEDELGDAVVGTDTVQLKQDDFSSTVTKANDSGADTIFYGGYYAEAARLIKQLRSGGFQGTFVTADGVKDDAYIEGGGTATEGTIITCPCLPPEKAPEFFDTFKSEYKEAPGTYTAEGFDSANVFLAGLDEGATDRAAMLEFIDGYEGPGVTKEVAFDENGEPANVVVWAYKVEDGEIVADQEIPTD
jgi:branched-chain amino acid transport system substrate-binding protein